MSDDERDRVGDRDATDDDSDRDATDDARIRERDAVGGERSSTGTTGAMATGAGTGATAAVKDDDRIRDRDALDHDHDHDDHDHDHHDHDHDHDDEATIGPEGYSEGTRLPSLGRLRGMEVRTTDDEKVGKVKDVYLDSDARYVRYLAVKTGWFSGTHVVPVDDVTFVEGDDAYVAVPYTQDQLKGAPTFGDDDEMTPDRERGIYDHYQRAGYWDDTRDIVRARQNAPAPTPQIAEAEVADAVNRGKDPRGVRVKRWGA